MAIRDIVQAAAGVGGDKLYVDDVFSTYLYAGNGSTQTITNGIDLAGEGGMVWNKCRTYAANHAMSDTERGIPSTLKPNKTLVESTSTGFFTSFNSDGWSMGGNTETNLANEQFASWTWRKAPKFFDIVTYTGNGVARNIAHSLGSVPGMIICKSTTYGLGWPVYHRSLGQYTNTLYLDATSSAGTSKWNEQLPTDSAFPISANDYVNKAGETYVAYLFAHNAGGFGDDGDQNVISCGSYTGNGAVGNEVTLGFEPQWLLVKSSTLGENWWLVDVMRGMPVKDYTGAKGLRPNTNSAEATPFGLYPTATGFVLADGGGAINENNATYIYMAIRRPMKTPESGTEVFNASSGGGSPYSFTAGFPVDMAIYARTNATSPRYNWSRLWGHRLDTTTTGAEQFYNNNTWAVDSNTQTANGWQGANDFAWMFKRAPSFMDVVCDTGTGSPKTEAHNLGVVPELIIRKSRSNSGPYWLVGSTYLSFSNDEYLRLSTTGATQVGGGSYWNGTAPTSSVFSVGNNSYSNGNNYTFVNYLFATLAGVSKVGSYSGTGAAVNVDCGFSAGARFILIKRTDSTGDWYVWDSVRGIVAGNDPYLRLNSTAAEVTNTDYIDPLASGFTVTSSAPAALNASGGSYLFLAIA